MLLFLLLAPSQLGQGTALLDLLCGSRCLCLMLLLRHSGLPKRVHRAYTQLQLLQLAKLGGCKVVRLLSLLLLLFVLHINVGVGSKWISRLLN